MAALLLNEIENGFARLSPDDQLSLLERLLHRVRLSVSGRQDNWENDLTTMAADPEVQRELTDIAAEFSATEVDGLRRE